LVLFNGTENSHVLRLQLAYKCAEIRDIQVTMGEE